MKQRMIQLVAAALSVIALTFGVTGVAFAGAATDAVKAKQASLFDLIRQGSPDGQKKIDALFDDMLDYQALAEGSLGSAWAARSDAEKAQFTDILKQLVRRAYQRNLKKLLDRDIQYVGEAPSPPWTLVKTVSKAKGGAGEPFSIDFKLAQKNGAWKVQDIVTEDESLVDSYRGQFVGIIKKDGFPALVQKMKDRLARGDAG